MKIISLLNPLFILISLFYGKNILALDAVVVVLETPLLKEKKLDSQAVQYLRKGDIIKIHPSLDNNNSYDYLSKEAESKINSDEFNDFIPTLDRQGNTVYLIRDHLFIYFSNHKELNQKTVKTDPTDYRLDEPLTKNYPLYEPSGLRGKVIVGMNQPYFESYPYSSNVKSKGYENPRGLSLAFSKRAPDDKQDRLYLGVVLNYKFFSNNYVLFSGINTREEGVRITLGPTISFDAYKGIKNRLAFYTHMNLSLINQLKITQSSQSLSETRSYKTINLYPEIGIEFHQKKIIGDIDFIFGTSITFEPPTNYKTKQAAVMGDWWKNIGSDEFTTRPAYFLGLHMGIQSSY